MKDHVPEISETELFLKYLYPLDIDKLDLILDDCGNYFGTSKKIFLERLAKIFEKYEQSYDNEKPLIVQSRKYSNTYNLKFSLLYKTVKFIIEEKNGRIVRMYNNKTLKYHKNKRITPFDLVFGDDEKPEFRPSTEYFAIEKNCEQAHRELKSTNQRVYRSTDIIRWLDNYKQLYRLVRRNIQYQRFNYFLDCYEEFQYLMTYLDFLPKVNEALNEFDDSDRQTIRKWLDKYDNLGWCDVIDFNRFFTRIDYDNQLFRYRDNTNSYLKGGDIEAILKFGEMFQKYSSLYPMPTLGIDL